MRKTLITAALAFAACWLFALPRVAVLNPAMAEGIEATAASPIMDKVQEELLKSRKFNILDRVSRDLVWDERNFQLSSGEIDQKEIKDIGRGLGADYVVVVKVMKVGRLYSLSATMIDVETLEVVAQSSAEAGDSVENLLDLASKCGRDISDVEFAAAGLEAGSAAVPGKNGVKDIEYYQAKEKARKLLKERVFMTPIGRDKLFALVGGFERQDRAELFREYRKPASSGFLGFLNVVPFLKVGSFIQGDVLSGVLYGLAEAGCFALYMANAGFYDGYGSEFLLFVGYVGAPIVWVCSWFQPLFYANAHNKNLSRALDVVAYGPPSAGASIASSAECLPERGARLALVSFRY